MSAPSVGFRRDRVGNEQRDFSEDANAVSDAPNEPDREDAPTPSEESPETPNEDDSVYGLEGAPSLLDDAATEDRCPKCGEKMPNPEAVVCLNCGFDQMRNTVIKTKVGAVEVDEDAGPREFVRAGRLGWKAPAIAGAVMLIAAAVLSGMHAEHRPIGHGVATLLFAPVFTGIGVAAVWLTAILMEERFGRLEHAAGRMLLAVAAVELPWHIAWNLELANPLRFLLGAGVGAGLYYLIVWWMFSLTRTVALMVSLLHLALWAMFMGLLRMNAWLAVAPGAA